MRQFLFLLVIAASLYSCSSSPATDTAKTTEPAFDLSQAKQSIEGNLKKFSETALKGDSTTVVGIYHTDARVFPPNMPAGDKNVMGSLAVGLPKMGVKTFTLNTIDVSGNAEQVVEIGTFEMADGSKIIEKGKYVDIWKQENGEWKLWRDIWNSDNPPASQSKK
jgi:ketosteroid isomerase-like protein